MKVVIMESDSDEYLGELIVKALRRED